MHDDVTQMIAPLHHLKFSRRDHATFSRDDSDVAHIGPGIVVEAPRFLGGTNLRLNRPGFHRCQQSEFDGANWLVLGIRQIAFCGQPATRRRRLNQLLGDLVP